MIYDEAEVIVEECKSEHGEEAFDWEELNDVSAIELRRDINPVDLENAEHRFVRNIYKNVADHIKVLKFRALIVADKVVAAEKLAREDKDTRSNVRCRVRVTTSNTLEISWYKLHSFRIPEGAAVVTGKTYKKNVDGKQITYMIKGVHLKKGRLHKYPASKFKGEPLWARRLIEESEDRNEILRKQSEILTEIRRLLCRYDKLTSDYYDDEVHPSFENMRLLPINLKGETED